MFMRSCTNKKAVWRELNKLLWQKLYLYHAKHYE